MLEKKGVSEQGVGCSRAKELVDKEGLEADAETKLLEAHEQVVAHQRAQFDEMVKKASDKAWVVVIDYAASICLKSQRGDAVEFFNPANVGAFGMYIYPKGAAVVILCHHKLHDSFWTLWNYKEALSLAVEKLGLDPPESVDVWSDAAKTMRSKEMAAALYEKELKIQSFNFWGEYHGKSICDSLFSAIKQHVGAEAPERWEKSHIPLLPETVEACFGKTPACCKFSDQGAEELEKRWGSRKYLEVKDISSTLCLRKNFASVENAVLTGAKFEDVVGNYAIEDLRAFEEESFPLLPNIEEQLALTKHQKELSTTLKNKLGKMKQALQKLKHKV